MLPHRDCEPDLAGPAPAGGRCGLCRALPGARPGGRPPRGGRAPRCCPIATASPIWPVRPRQAGDGASFGDSRAHARERARRAAGASPMLPHRDCEPEFEGRAPSYQGATSMTRHARVSGPAHRISVHVQTRVHLAEMVVRAAGVEPARPIGPGILSAMCLPFHHARIAFSGPVRARHLPYRPGAAGTMRFPGEAPCARLPGARHFTTRAGPCKPAGQAPLATPPLFRAAHPG
jgi:hypothetical protein